MAEIEGVRLVILAGRRERREACRFPTGLSFRQRHFSAGSSVTRSPSTLPALAPLRRRAAAREVRPGLEPLARIDLDLGRSRPRRRSRSARTGVTRGSAAITDAGGGDHDRVVCASRPRSAATVPGARSIPRPSRRRPGSSALSAINWVAAGALAPPLPLVGQPEGDRQARRPGRIAADAGGVEIVRLLGGHPVEPAGSPPRRSAPRARIASRSRPAGCGRRRSAPRGRGGAAPPRARGRGARPASARLHPFAPFAKKKG